MFEIELVKQVEVNIDYILRLVEMYKENVDKEALTKINIAIRSSMQLRSKKELIENFVNEVNIKRNIEWSQYVKEQKEKDVNELIEKEKLREEETKKLVSNALRDGVLKTTGTEIDKILPPMSRFGGNNRYEKKNKVIEKLKELYEKYEGLINT